MASQPSYAHRNTIKFPTDPLERRGHAALGAGDRNDNDPATREETRPKSLRAALDAVSAAETEFEQPQGTHPGGDSLENRIAARIGKIGATDADEPTCSLPPPPPMPLTADPEGKIAYDPELIEILEQLNQTLDTAHAVLNDGGGPQPALMPAATQPGAVEPRRRRLRPTVLTLAALAVVIGAAGLIYAQPWTLDRAASARQAEEAIAHAKPTPETANETPARRGAERLGRLDVAPSQRLAAITPADSDATRIKTQKRAPMTPAASAFAVEPARGTAGEPIALALTVPSRANGPETSVLIQGLPDGARLSAGKKLHDDSWVLEPGDSEGLMLMLPDGFFAGRFTLDVTLVTSDGQVPETRKLAVTVAAAEPAPAGPASPVVAAKTPEPVTPTPQQPQTSAAAAPQQPARSAAQLSEASERRLVARGRRLMRDGDIAGARLVLEHAARRGSAGAMAALAQSYDPQHLSKLGVQGIQPDIEKAISWYERASRSGDRKSRVRAEALTALARH